MTLFYGTFVINLKFKLDTRSKMFLIKWIVCKFIGSVSLKVSAPPLAPRYHAVWWSNLRQLDDE